jgi:hypothetical protein
MTIRSTHPFKPIFAYHLGGLPGAIGVGFVGIS